MISKEILEAPKITICVSALSFVFQNLWAQRHCKRSSSQHWLLVLRLAAAMLGSVFVKKREELLSSTAPYHLEAMKTSLVLPHSSLCVEGIVLSKETYLDTSLNTTSCCLSFLTATPTPVTFEGEIDLWAYSWILNPRKRRYLCITLELQVKVKSLSFDDLSMNFDWKLPNFLGN